MFVCFPDVERNVLAYNDLYIFILILVAVSWYQYLLQSMWKKLKMKFMCIKCMSFHCSLTRGSLQLQRAVLDFVGSSQTWRICISFYIVCYYEQSWNHWRYLSNIGIILHSCQGQGHMIIWLVLMSHNGSLLFKAAQNLPYYKFPVLLNF